MQNNYETSDELQHYGVKGMKWGIRRNTRAMANSRRNIVTRDAKYGYKTGKISKDERDAKIKEANNVRKQHIASTKSAIKQVNDKTRLEQFADKTRKQKTAVADLDYKNKQVYKTNNYYNRDSRSGFYGLNVKKGINSLNKSIEKDKLRYERTGDRRYLNRAAVTAGKIKLKEKMRDAEIIKVTQLTHDDIQKERVAVGKSIVKDLGVSLAVSTVGLGFFGVGYGQYTDPQSVRSQMRFKS